MLAEKELQGRQPTRVKSSFTPRHTSTTPSTSRAPATAHFLTTPSTSRVPSTSMTPPPAPPALDTTPPVPRAAANHLRHQPHPPVAPPILSATVVME
jgi:hypothetical protein